MLSCNPCGSKWGLQTSSLKHVFWWLQYYAFVEEKQKVHCLNTLFSKVSPLASPPLSLLGENTEHAAFLGYPLCTLKLTGFRWREDLQEGH